ncbi:hypothetical protein [Parapedobacter sp. 2B3]|uniref:hypothetical protein n=1 Tax=Parapedobacter sp. 2B3 TaxID=3342381 RepID=UPI0035B5A72A
MRNKKETIEAVGRSEGGKATFYDRVKETLAVASQLVIASPVKLPPKVVAVAKYVALALGVLETLERVAKQGGEDHEDE